MTLRADALEAVERIRRVGDDLFDVEAKAAQGGFPRRGCLETTCAFSNTDGGLLLLGVAQEDGFATVDVDAARLARDLASACSTDIEPPLRPTIDIVEVEGSNIVACRVNPLPTDQRPAYVKSRGLHGGSFVRTHDGNHALTTYEIHVVLSRRGQPVDDEMPDGGTSPDDLDDDLVNAFATRLRRTRPNLFGTLTTPRILEIMGVTTDAGGTVMTRGGLLALGRYPQQHLPQVNISLVVYPTVDGRPAPDGTRFLDNQVIEGSIPAMLIDAVAALQKNLQRRSLQVGLLREDRWEYPTTALRETIANALMHRDLSSQALGTQVRIELYPDRLVITSPGGLHGPVAEEDLMNEPVSSSRNARLAKMLEDVPVRDTQGTVCENRGSGLIALAASMQQAGMEPPVLHDRIREFRVTLRNTALLDDESVEFLNSLDLTEINDTQRMALAFARRHGSITNAQYRTLAGLASAKATRELSDLGALNHLVRDGAGRGARWLYVPQVTILADPPPEAPVRQEGERHQERAILDALTDGPRSSEELRRETQIGSKRAVLQWLNRMETEGKVSPTERNKRSPKNKWRLPG